MLVVVTRVPDIVVTLAMSFVWAGAALLVLNTPGGGAAPLAEGDHLRDRSATPWLPKALVVLAVIVGRRLDPAPPLDASACRSTRVGSSRLAAFRSGVPVGRTKIVAYALTGLFSALGGLALTATTGIGAPVPGLLHAARASPPSCSAASASPAAAAASLGPIVAVFVLALVRTDLTFARRRPECRPSIQGAILIGVVMFGSLVAMRRVRA